ncbi:MAG: hypothetical protein KTV77_04015 [Wolbachia endosymbiont of Fragariocoptes setiger]|nr:hypothetical protein [Wolbachia endosymbiont of Fragariocoptes setiger]
MSRVIFPSYLLYIIFLIYNSWSPNGLHDLNIEIKNFNDDLNQIEKNLIYLLEGMEFLDKDENIADLCWNNGHSIAKSNELVRLAIDIKDLEKLLKRFPNDKKIEDLIDKKKREYDNSINLDRQLIAESKLKEQGINLYGGKKTLEVRVN